MKIRTDFVTNSSSSSFVAYKAKGDALQDFVDRFNISFYFDDLDYENEGSFEDGEYFIQMDTSGSGYTTLPQLMVLTALDEEQRKYFWNNDLDNTDEWQALDNWNYDKTKLLPKTPYSNYQFKNTNDGTPESILKLFYELFANTDFEEGLHIITFYNHGGGECCPWEAEFCGLYCGGEQIEKDSNGVIRGYIAHTYDCGWGYGCGENFIEYTDNELTLSDASGASEDDNVTYTNEDVERTIRNVIAKGNGLNKIRIKCSEVTEVTIPDCVLCIDEETFEDCPGLERVIIERSNTNIEENSLPYNVTVVGYHGSYAEIYANKNGLEFKSILELETLETEKAKQRFIDNCIIVDSITSFEGKTFVATGLDFESDDIKKFLTEKGAFLRSSVSGKTDYLIVKPETAGNSKYNAVLNQARCKGHIVEVIFYDDFIQYMPSCKDTTVGYPGSYAEQYADGNGQDFGKIKKTMPVAKRVELMENITISCPPESVFEPETENNYAAIKSINLPLSFPGETIDVLIGTDTDMTFEEYSEDESEDERFHIYSDGTTTINMYCSIATKFFTTYAFLIALFIEDERLDNLCYFQITFSSSDIEKTKAALECLYEMFKSIEISGHKLAMNFPDTSVVLEQIINAYNNSDGAEDDQKTMENHYVNISFEDGTQASLSIADLLKAAEGNDDDDDYDSFTETRGTVTKSPEKVVVMDDFEITIPEGYVYSTDTDVIGEHRSIIFMLNDETANFDGHFGSTINFSSICASRSTDNFVSPFEDTDFTSYSGLIKLKAKAPFFFVPPIVLTSDICATEYIRDNDEDFIVIAGTIFTKKDIYTFQAFFNHTDDHTFTEDEAKKHIVTWLQSLRPANSSVITPDLSHLVSMESEIEAVSPSDESYAWFYYQCKENNENCVRMAVNLPFAMYNDSPEYQFKRINLGQNPGEFPTAEVGWLISRLFAVNSEDFNVDLDKQSEIQMCIIRQADQLSALRSFAWCTGEYCRIHNCNPDDLDLSQLLSLCHLVQLRGNLCYCENGRYPALCDIQDVEICYALPEDGIESKVHDIMGNDSYAVGNLEELRHELNDICPCIGKLALSYIRYMRDSFSVQCGGIVADIVQAWSSLALAATDTFVSDHSLMGYFASPSNGEFSDFELEEI